MFTIIEIRTKEKKVIFKQGKGRLVFDCEIGKNGISKEGAGKEGDKKTPLGKFKIQFIRLPEPDQKHVFTVIEKPKINLGVAFVCFDCKLDGKLRGIGIHGNENGDLEQTNGCIRMRNKDLSSVVSSLEVGTDVVIV